MDTTEPQLTRSVDEPEAVTYSFGEWVLRVVRAPLSLLGALVIPDRVMPRVVGRERGGLALAVVVLAAGLAALSIGSRLDPTATVLANETMMVQAQGADAEPRSDREIAEEITKQRTMGQVMLGLSAGVWTPFLVGLLALGVFAAGRFVGGKPTMRASFAAAAHGMLPMGIKSVAVAIAAYSATALSPTEVDNLWRLGAIGPLGPLQGLDLFAVWSAVLFFFGLAAAASISRRRALVTSLVLFAMFILIFGNFGGHPPGPMPPHGPR